MKESLICIQSALCLTSRSPVARLYRAGYTAGLHPRMRIQRRRAVSRISRKILHHKWTSDHQLREGSRNADFPTSLIGAFIPSNGQGKLRCFSAPSKPPMRWVLMGAAKLRVHSVGPLGTISSAPARGLFSATPLLTAFL